nr:germin-like protein subfamily 1 member 20 [Quercus suber]
MFCFSVGLNWRLQQRGVYKPMQYCSRNSNLYCYENEACKKKSKTTADYYHSSTEVFVNGKLCEDPKLTTVDDFIFMGLDVPRKTLNQLGSNVTLVNVDMFPGLNTLGIALAHVDYAPYGLNPPHIHPRASELLTVIEALVNGKFCKDPKLTTVDDFIFMGLDVPRNTLNQLGSNVTLVNVDMFPGLNTLGIALAHVDYAPYGLNPPHIHPRASKLLTVIEGTLLVGFVTSNPDN